MKINEIDYINKPFKKFVETLQFGEPEWEVETPDGWADINAVGKTIKYKVWELVLKSGKSLRCADNHILLKIDNYAFSEVYTKELLCKDIILTKDGPDEVISCVETDDYENMYDLEINSNSKLYYTNDIVSHNSIWLANLAANSVKQGYNTAYISLEMRDRKVVKRLGANILGIRMSDYNKIATDKVTLKQKLRDVGYESLVQPGRLYVKEFPTSSASVLDLERYLLKMEEINGIKFKTVFVDYINIMKNWRNPNTENLYMKIKQIAEDLRAMAMRNDWAVVTATQVNRCLALDSIVQTPNGPKRIGDIIEGDEVLTPTGYSQVGKVWPIQKQKTYKIKTKSGKEIIASGIHQHPIIDRNGNENLVTTLQLHIGDKFIVND